MFAVIGLLLFTTLSAAAQTRAIDGVVRTSSGEPVPGVTVAITPLPMEEADDVAAWMTTDATGHFHFGNLAAGKYEIGAASATVCGGTATVDVTGESAQSIAIVPSGPCRTISGRVTGPGVSPHVIAGHFVEHQGQLYAAPIRDGRYAIALPATGTAVVQALAPRYASAEAPLFETNDATRDLVLEVRDMKMPDAARRWLASHAIPLKSVTAGSGFDDMRPLRNLIGNARIVALGEQTHGTREFFQFKHRMLEFLVSQMGFNVFAIEASTPDAMAVDDYVLHGTGDPAAALKGLGFWTWNTEEVLEMIRWMRKWNEDPSHTRKLRFYGFDMQNPDAAKERLRKWQESKAASSVEDAATMQHLADVIHQADTKGSPARDRAMAENIQWIVAHEGAGSKVVVWAHNGHVSAEPLAFASGGTMGVHLRKAFGASMVVIGFVFNRGAFQAVDTKKGLIEQHAEPIDEISFDRGLASIGVPMFVVDLRKATGATRAWLASSQRHRSIGAVYDEAMPKAYVGRVHPLQSYDAVFFIDQTTTARAVRPPRPKPAPAAVNLSFDDGIGGWTLSNPSVEAGYTVRAETADCFKGGCATMSIGERKGEAPGSFAQRIDATPFRGKRVRFRMHLKSQSSARLWMRVDRPYTMGFFDNMADRAPKSLPDWTELEITGDVAPDAEAIAFGVLFPGPGTVGMDEAALEVVRPDE